MSMLVFMLTDASIDKDRLMKICLMHDVAEAVVGDITPHDPVTKEEKRRLEEVPDVCCTVLRICVIPSLLGPYLTPPSALS